MATACRHKQWFARRRAKLDREMPAVARGRAPQIDDDIEDSSSQNANQLGLCKRPCLEVQAADGSWELRRGLVVLEEILRDPGCSEIVAHVGFRKISPSVGDARRPHQLDIRDGK